MSAERDLKRLLGSIDGEVGLRRVAAAGGDPGPAAGRRAAAWRICWWCSRCFAAILALVGIYGVVAYTVKQREREIAVRLAMGADRRRITRMFVGQGAIVLGAGLVLGIGGALALGRVLRAQLFGVEPADPLVLAGMTTGLRAVRPAGDRVARARGGVTRFGDGIERLSELKQSRTITANFRSMVRSTNLSRGT